MNYSDIIALAKAGFTAQQIAQMAAIGQQVPTRGTAKLFQESDGTVHEVMAGGGGSAPVPQEPAPAPVQQEPTPAPVQQTPDQFAAILAEMQTLKQTVQAQNRQNAELIPPTPQSAQDILANIIAPPKRDGDK